MDRVEGAPHSSDRPTRRAPPPPELLELARGQLDPEAGARPTLRIPVVRDAIESDTTPETQAATDPFAIDRRRRAIRALAAIVVAVAILVAIAFAAQSTGPAAPRAWW